MTKKEENLEDEIKQEKTKEETLTPDKNDENKKTSEKTDEKEKNIVTLSQEDYDGIKKQMAKVINDYKDLERDLENFRKRSELRIFDKIRNI